MKVRKNQLTNNPSIHQAPQLYRDKNKLVYVDKGKTFKDDQDRCTRFKGKIPIRNNEKEIKRRGEAQMVEAKKRRLYIHSFVGRKK